MGVVSATQQMTAEEFIAAPVPEHGRPWNLIDGEVVVNFPTLLHGQAQDNLLLALKLWTRSGSDRGRAGSPADIGLDDRNVFAPDVLWYAAGRVPALEARPPYPMPDLVAEVRSPSTWRFDVGVKKAGYEHHGLRELWLVDTIALTVLVYRRSRTDGAAFDVALELAEDEQLTSSLLPGFALTVADIFCLP